MKSIEIVNQVGGVVFTVFFVSAGLSLMALFWELGGMTNSFVWHTLIVATGWSGVLAAGTMIVYSYLSYMEDKS